MHHPDTCCRLCCQGQIRCSLSQCPGSKSATFYLRKTGKSPTTHSYPHQQHHNHWHCQSYNQMSMIPRHGNALLLAIGRQNSEIFQQAGQENLGDYPSKHHTADIHQHVQPYYVHTNTSPIILPHALKPSILWMYAETPGDPYNKKSPLPHLMKPSSHLPVTPNISSHWILG